MTLNKNLINDEAMFQAIYSFIKKDADYSSILSSTKTKELVSIFGKIKLSDINSTTVIKCLENKKYTATTQRFLIDLCKTVLSPNNDLQNIRMFEKSFSKIALPGQLIYFLKSNFIQKYKEKYPIETQESRFIFFCDVVDIDFKDNILKEKISYYLNYIIKFSVGSPSSIKNRCHEIINICRTYLSIIDKDNITKESINKYLLSNNVRKGTMHELHKLLLFLCNDKVIKDKDIERICLIKEKITSLPIEKYIELLCSNNLNRYFIRKGKDNKYDALLYAPILSDELFNAVKKYADSFYQGSYSFVYFLENFESSIEGLGVKGIDSLSISTFTHQIKYFSSYKDKNIISFVVGFYFFIANNYNSELFKKDGFDTRLLQRLGIGKLLINGFDLIKFNPIEDVPVSDKWILFYFSDYESNSATSSTNTIILDFTKIHNKTYRDWFKFYIWKNNSSLSTKTHMFSIVMNFFNYIDDIKKGKEISFLTGKTDNINITVNDIIAWKNHLINTCANNRTRTGRIYAIRRVLSFIKENDITELSNGIYYYLEYSLDNNYNNALAVPDDHLKQLSKLMEKKSEENITSAVYYLAFYIALETEFRASQLFSLKVDCVRETAKKNEYVLVSKTKTSANQEVEQPITVYVKRHIDEILNLTKEYRHKSNIEGASEYLFITSGQRKNSYVILNSQSFNSFLQKCCKELNLPLYSYKNLRKTHMTKAEEFIIRNQMSEIEQNILSGHQSSTIDNKHYIDTSIKNLLESVHGVIIGNIDVSGKIKESLSSDIASPENSVSNNCGYCSSKSCNDNSFLDCILCKDFVTTIDRLPYFEEQVKIIDEKIKNTIIPHDKEDLVNIKRLHLGFISKILELKSKKGEDKNATN